MKQSDEVKILIAGDFCPINRVEELALKGDYESVFNDYIDVLKGNDLNIVDLECPLTLSERTRLKTGPHQKAHPETIKLLNHAGIGLVAMANNHIMDYDAKGAIETLELCNQNKINTVGIGSSSKEAAMPYLFQRGGNKIAILNYADNEFLSSTNGNLICNTIDIVRCFYEISEAKKENDFVICIIHAGNEFYNLPSPRTKGLYRFLADAGADVIISHHTHVYSGYEIYNDTPIFYGLGNFMYDWPGKINLPWNYGYIVKLQISENINFELVPLRQGNVEPGVFRLDERENLEFNSELDRLNMIIADDKLLEEEFQRYCDSVFPMYDAFIEPYFGKVITALQRRRLFPKMLSRKKRLYHLNLSRCESHRDVVMRMLKRYE